MKAYDEKVAAGEAQPPPQALSSQQEPPSLAGLHLSKAPTVSQSLPSGGHMNLSRLPPKPRVRPSAPGISQLPILELPEASPHSCSLLDENPLSQPGLLGTRIEEDEEVGGTCVPARARPAAPRAYALSGFLKETACCVPSLFRRSMLEPTAASRGGQTFMYAASAPATMLWGPTPGHRCVQPHRCHSKNNDTTCQSRPCMPCPKASRCDACLFSCRLGGNAMGGRTPSKTLLESLASRDGGGA